MTSAINITAVGDVLDTGHTYDWLIEKGTPPGDAARKALLRM